MTSILLIFLPREGTRAEAALTQLRELASTGAFIVDGPFELDGPVPPADPARLTRAAEILERAARGRKIAEGLARAKAEGRRIGRPLSDRAATTTEVVLARDSGQSWRSIESMYGIPATTARRHYQNALSERLRPRINKASRREAKCP